MASQEGLVLSRSISWFSRVPTGCWGSRSRCRPPGRALSWQGLGKLRIPFPSGTLYVMAELTFSAFFSCWYGRLKINVYVRIGKLMVFANRTLLQHDFFSHPVSNRNHIYTFSLVPTPPLPMKAGDPGRTSHHVLTLWRLQLTSVRNTKSTQGHWRTSWRRIPRQAQVWSPGHCQSRIQALRSSIPGKRRRLICSLCRECFRQWIRRNWQRWRSGPRWSSGWNADMQSCPGILFYYKPTLKLLHAIEVTLNFDTRQMMYFIVNFLMTFQN